MRSDIDIGVRFQFNASTPSSSNSTVSYTVDAAGNLTSDGLRTFEYDAANRLSKTRIFKDGEAMSINYLHNALGQRVFKGEVTAEQYLPDESELGQSFIDWLRQRFRWMFESQRASTSIGTAYVYADEDAYLPPWATLGSYDNGSASGTGRSEYVWLPLPDGGAIPVAMYRNGQKYAIHPDHLGTPRVMTDASANPVWQWPYSGFGENRPIGILVPTTDPMQATTIAPTLMKANTPTVTLDLRFPGQMADGETGTYYNYYRSYLAGQGRYTQADPIGLDGAWNRFGYVEGNPLAFLDPQGLQTVDALPFPGTTTPAFTAVCLTNPIVCGAAASGLGGFAVGSLLYPYVAEPLGEAIDQCVAMAAEHTKNPRPSNWNKHTKPRPGRDSEKKRQDPNWKPNPNKKK